MAVGSSKLVSPYVPPAKAASLCAEAVLRRLLRRLSQDLAGAVLGPRRPLPPARPPEPYIKNLLVSNPVSVLLCPGKGRAASLGESQPRGHPPPVVPTSCPWGAGATGGAGRTLCAGDVAPAPPGKVGLEGCVNVWWHPAFPSGGLPKGRDTGRGHPHRPAIPGGCDFGVQEAAMDSLSRTGEAARPIASARLKPGLAARARRSSMLPPHRAPLRQGAMTTGSDFQSGSKHGQTPSLAMARWHSPPPQHKGTPQGRGGPAPVQHPPSPSPLYVGGAAPAVARSSDTWRHA